MATKRPSQLPAIGSVSATDLLVVEDGGGVVRKATVAQLPGGGGRLLTGTDAPGAALGSDDDTYLDTSAGEIWAKANGAWTKELRRLAINVLDYGAVGDGTGDDTQAFIDAIAELNQSGKGGTVHVPPGVYQMRGDISIVPVAPIRIVGEGSVIRRVANYATTYGTGFTRLFYVGGARGNPAADADGFGYYPCVTFKDLVFDGNRDNQVTVGGVAWEGGDGGSLEQMHGVSVEADHAHPYRQPARFVGCTFLNAPGDGLHQFANSRVELERCRFHACWRGGFVFAGSHNELIARDCISDDPLDQSQNNNASGLYFELEPQGYTRSNFVSIDNWTFHQGGINVVTFGDQKQYGGQDVAPLLPNEKVDVVLRGLRVMPTNRAEQVKFYNSGEANFLISDSIFYGARHDGVFNLSRRTMIDGRNIECRNCVFVASNQGLPVEEDAPGFYAALVVRDFNEVTHGRQRHRFIGCRLLLDDTCHAGAPVYGVYADFIGGALSRAAPDVGAFPPPFISFDHCSWQILKYYPDRDDTAAPVVRRFDYLFMPANGTPVSFLDCDGYGKKGFRLKQGQAGLPGFYEFVGGRYAVDEELFELGMPVGEPGEQLGLRFSGFWQEDRFNHFAHTEAGQTEWNRIKVYGGREILVVSDPTLSGPVQITNRLLHDVVRTDNLYRVRLEGTPIVAGSLTIVNQDTSATLTDNGSGALTGAGAGTIDYATGRVTFSWAVAPGDQDRILHAYEHGNDVPGFAGDVAVLKTDPSQRWRCTTGHPTAAAWTALL